jgi:glycosyltransferase involved in cell wall biosynthesis/GT2 family glycosyltransferase
MSIETGGENQAKSEHKIRQWLAQFEPGCPVVVVPVFNAFEDTLDCIHSLLENTPQEVPVLLIDDASTDTRLSEYFQPLAFKDRFAYLYKPVNSGFVGSVNLGFELTAPRDVIVINSDVVLPSGWLERLKAAAYSGSTIVTVTPLTNHGSILSVPYRNKPSGKLPDNFTLAEIDDRVRQNSLKLFPPIPAAVGHCTYFKRLGLDLIGYFDPAFAPGYGEEVDFSQRAIMSGLTNVLADDLFVYHKGSRSFSNSEARQQLRESHDELIKQRYPWYLDWIGEAMNLTDSPLALALEQARHAILGYKVALDATCLDGNINGTEVVTLELTRALAELKDSNASFSLIVRDETGQEDLLGLENLVNEVITVAELKKRPQPAFDLVHRPFQIYSLEDLELLQQIATRFIITHLDSLPYATPSYAPNPDWWSKLRHFTRLTFASSDGIIFISQEAQQAATRQGLQLPQDRTCVTYAGVNHRLHHVEATLPPDVPHLTEQPFILMLGTNYQHKNRAFGLQVFAKLLQDYDWAGNLVFAGNEKAAGGSSLEESRQMHKHPVLQGRVINLGKVTEGEKQWLLENTALLLYPSTVEGFGMVPFEAALAGKPAITPCTSSLHEVLGDGVTYMPSFEPAEAVKSIWQLLSQPELAYRQTASIQARAAAFTWEKIAEETWEFYRQTLKKAPRLPKTIVQHMSQISRLEQEYRKLQGWSEELNQKLLRKENTRLFFKLKKFLEL